MASEVLSSDFLIRLTVRGICRPEDQSNKITKGFELMKQALPCYSDISPVPLLYAVAN